MCIRDSKDAGDDVVSGYKKNLKEIQDLTGKGKKDYKEMCIRDSR